MNFLRQFSQALKQPDPAPERLALLIAGMAFPTLDVDAYLAQLDQLAAAVQRTLLATPPGRMRAEHFLQVVNDSLGFTGNRDNYYEPANSFLNRVLDQRTGLPIMLSLLCMAIGRRIGLDITGIGFPGHFVARYRDERGVWLLDPFHGQVLNPADAADYLSTLFAQPITLAPEAYATLSAAALAQRILNNLRNVYLSQRNFGMAVAVMDYLLVLVPKHAPFWRERGLLHHHTDNWEAASHDLRRYFFLAGQWMLAMGQEKNGELVAATLSNQDRQLLLIFHQIEAASRRIN
ncbi:MAG: transglutaminase-like domain-containing protein [Chloroflexota bacterium]|nr:transglutaminase-like domain-containing protein [Chloroflexota bacterium]